MWSFSRSKWYIVIHGINWNSISYKRILQMLARCLHKADFPLIQSVKICRIGTLKFSAGVSHPPSPTLMGRHAMLQRSYSCERSSRGWCEYQWKMFRSNIDAHLGPRSSHLNDNSQNPLWVSMEDVYVEHWCSLRSLFFSPHFLPQWYF